MTAYTEALRMMTRVGSWRVGDVDTFIAWCARQMGRPVELPRLELVEAGGGPSAVPTRVGILFGRDVWVDETVPSGVLRWVDDRGVSSDLDLFGGRQP